MIKSNELRIGNYLLYNNKPRVVRDISTDNITVELDEAFKRNCTTSELSPIPLTTKLLDKAGFVNYYTNPRLETFYVNTSSYYPFQIYETRDGYIYFNENLEIKSLHQLQNLFFALTGEELPINL